MEGCRIARQLAYLSPQPDQAFRAEEHTHRKLVFIFHQCIMQ